MRKVHCIWLNALANGRTVRVVYRRSQPGSQRRSELSSFYVSFVRRLRYPRFWRSKPKCPRRSQSLINSRVFPMTISLKRRIWRTKKVTLFIVNEGTHEDVYQEAIDIAKETGLHCSKTDSFIGFPPSRNREKHERQCCKLV